MNFNYQSILWLLLIVSTTIACQTKSETTEQSGAEEKIEPADAKIPVLFDTDANNEIDDQHALAYLFFNAATFDVVGVTTNATKHGGDATEHAKEAERIMKFCKVENKYPLIAGTNGNFETIAPTLSTENYDGAKAVEFIIEQAKKERTEKLVLMPVGKLTNIALALMKAPEIADKVKIVWLGSNYPNEGEYNQDNDTSALSYILKTTVAFEMVTVRYGEPSGSDAVRVTPAEIEKNMKGAGFTVEPIEGRHGKSFTNFGDYAYDLFQHIDLYGDPPARALFDVVAVAITKNQNWGKATKIPAPALINNKWQEQPSNSRKITVWENFDKEGIIADFYEVMQNPVVE